MSRTTIDVRGVRLSAMIEGTEDGPWVTFAHSLATDASLFDEQARALAGRYRILRFDMRGHGRSAAPPRPYALADLARDVVGLWDALGIERSHFVGLSIGGMTGFGLALDHPERLSSLTACDCRADAPAFFQDMWDQRQALVARERIEGIVEPTLATWFTDHARARDPALIEGVRAMIRRTSREGYLGCSDALKSLDYKPRLGEIGTPTLMIVGDADGPHPTEMRALAERVPGARLVEIGPAGHLSNLEQPAAFNDALIGFLESLEGSPVMIDTAIVGLGWWGRTIVQRMQGSDKLRLVRAVDVRPEAAASFAAEHGLPLAASLDEALADPAIQAVILATPHSLHKDQVLRSAAAGKHTFCEKPLALTSADAKAMVQACRERGLVLGIGHERRFEPALVEIKRLIDAGELGTVLHLEADFSHDKLAGVPADNWRSSKIDSPIPAITAMGIHITDAFIHMVGDVTEVYTQTARRIMAAEGGDVASVQLRFAGGATGFLSCILVTPLYLRFTVFGSKAWVEVRNHTHPDTPGRSTLTLCRAGGAPESREFAWLDPVRANIEAFADAVAGRAPYPFSDAHKIANIAVLEALCQSAETGLPVRPAP